MHDLQLYLCSKLGTKKAVLTLELFQNERQDCIHISEKINYIFLLLMKHKSNQNLTLAFIYRYYRLLNLNHFLGVFATTYSPDFRF